MRKSVVSIGGGIALAMSVVCAPVVSAAFALPATVPATALDGSHSLVELARGGHRRCRRHYVPRWDVVAKHTHRGERNRPRACGRRWRGPGRPPGWRARGCFIIGPIWYCP
ncbi:MAG: hypothetical protein ACR2PG_13020 [Hyphomicrobiaceae bacterium]